MNSFFHKIEKKKLKIRCLHIHYSYNMLKHFICLNNEKLKMG